MAQEDNVQSSTERGLGADRGPNSAAIDRVLRQQGVRLGANIALLAQRYEIMPHDATQARRAASGPARVMDAGDDLPALVAQHRTLLRNIATLIGQRPDGQRGELILAEIARNHEEMVAVLSALIEENVVRDVLPIPTLALRDGGSGARGSATA